MTKSLHEILEDYIKFIYKLNVNQKGSRLRSSLDRKNKGE